MQDVNNEVENDKAVNNERRKSVRYQANESHLSGQDGGTGDAAGSSQAGTMKRMSDSNQDFKKKRHRSTSKIDNGDEAEVSVSGKYNSSGITITIKAPGILDLRAVHLIRNVDEFVRSYKRVRVIIDLGRTRRIQDSGLAMLLLLKKKLGQKIEKIKLINTRRLQHTQFNSLPAIFEIN